MAPLLALAACGGETGLIIEVTRDAESTPANIDRLALMIGVPLDGAAFAQEADPLADIDLGASRDLVDDPYELLLRPGDGMAAGGERGDRVMVVAVGFRGQEPVGYGRLDEPRRFVDGEVRKWSLVLRGQPDFEISDTGCVTYDGGILAPRDDLDCDGDLAPDDCDDRDPTIGPSSPERCFNEVDDDCDGEQDELEDRDADGVNNCDDCDDTNELVAPGLEEVCDGLDNDCSGACDDGFDGDGDRYTTCGSKVKDDPALCEAPVAEKVDCDDGSDEVYPGAEEVCDGADNDCNWVCDDEWDPDGDMFTECGSHVIACDGTDPANIDCEPEDAQVHPFNSEICDGKDNDCDGVYFEGDAPCYAQADGDCILGERECDDAGGIGLIGECEVEDRRGIPEFEAPMELCTAYEQCEDMGAPDPYQCANAVAAAGVATCVVRFPRLGQDELCPDTYERLPLPDSDGCRWSVLGGGDQAHYRVGFSNVVEDAPGGALSDVINACDVFFVVERSFEAPPLHDEFLIWHRTAANAAKRLLHVKLAPSHDPMCSDRGMECTGLAP